MAAYLTQDGGVASQQKYADPAGASADGGATALEMQDFVRAARTGEQPHVTAEDATQALRFTHTRCVAKCSPSL